MARSLGSCRSERLHVGHVRLCENRLYRYRFAYIEPAHGCRQICPQESEQWDKEAAPSRRTTMPYHIVGTISFTAAMNGAGLDGSSPGQNCPPYPPSFHPIVISLVPESVHLILCNSGPCPDKSRPIKSSSLTEREPPFAYDMPVFPAAAQLPSGANAGAAGVRCCWALGRVGISQLECAAE